MQIRKFKKLWKKNIASIRDYELVEYINDGGVIFEYRKKVMKLSREDLTEKRFDCHNRFIQSKKPGWRNPISGLNGYQLVDFVFKPKENTNEQICA